ncbi:MAG: endonuclease YncB(thermonuclease family) [Myxococcota bacterium]|jgi:endonuclease YncB( thermonuclease family)
MHRVISFFLAAGLCLAANTALAQPQNQWTRVILNGRPTGVFFNDGDSFRVMEGPLKHSKARLAGFNTLESYGPCHLWGNWTMKELYRYATLGTQHAVNGGLWTCTGDMNKKDGYGRVLWDCPALRDSQIRLGLAHAMTVTSEGAHPDAVKAQEEAIRAKRGIWAHGVPDYVLTSLHSTTENYDKGPYNRMIASSNGHSKKWVHEHGYRECQTACQPRDDLDPAKVSAFVKEQLSDPTYAGYFPTANGAAPMSPEVALTGYITEFAKEGWAVRDIPNESVRWKIEKPIAAALAAGTLTHAGKPMACMLYVAFQRRYGHTRAECLK